MTSGAVLLEAIFGAAEDLILGGPLKPGDAQKAGFLTSGLPTEAPVGPEAVLEAMAAVLHAGLSPIARGGACGLTLSEVGAAVYALSKNFAVLAEACGVDPKAVIARMRAGHDEAVAAVGLARKKTQGGVS